MFRKLSAAALLVLAAGASAQVAKKVANVPLCGTPRGTIFDPFRIDLELNGGIATPVFAGLFPVPAPGTLTSAVPLAPGNYVGDLFAGACPAPAALPGGATIGDWASTCNNDILQPVVAYLGVGGIASPAALATACGGIIPAAAATGAAGTRCTGSLAVTTNQPKKKFPGSTEFFDYTPDVGYVVAGGFSDDAFAVATTNYWCVFAPTINAVAQPAGGTGRWTKSYVNSVTLASRPILPAAGMFIAGAGGGPVGLPTNAALLAGPLQRLQYATTSTVDYFKNYLNWNRL